MRIRQSTIDKHVGKKYGMLTVTGFSHKSGKTKYYVNVRCDCGTEKLALLGGMQQGTTKSCGCYALEMSRKLHAGNTYRRIGAGKANSNRVFERYKTDAKRRGLDFSLSRDDWDRLVCEPCFYCDQPPSSIYAGKNSNGAFVYSGIDRVDNSIGYQPDNCVPCCAQCNSAKNSATKAIILKAAEFILARNVVSSVTSTEDRA